MSAPTRTPVSALEVALVASAPVGGTRMVAEILLRSLRASGWEVVPVDPTDALVAAATGGDTNRKDLSGVRRIFLTCWRRAVSYSRRTQP